MWLDWGPEENPAPEGETSPRRRRVGRSHEKYCSRKPFTRDSEKPLAFEKLRHRFRARTGSQNEGFPSRFRSSEQEKRFNGRARETERPVQQKGSTFQRKTCALIRRTQLLPAEILLCNKRRIQPAIWNWGTIQVYVYNLLSRIVNVSLLQCEESRLSWPRRRLGSWVICLVRRAETGLSAAEAGRR